jgi:hypothetical protein
MTNADLDQIEQALGFPLPAFYRAFMLDYPRWLRARQPRFLRPVDKGDFADDPDLVIELNQFVRAQQEGDFFENRLWPEEYLVIGTEYDQNYYFINRGDGTETVYFWSHEDGEVTPLASTLDGYSQWLLEWWAGMETEDTEESGDLA